MGKFESGHKKTGGREKGVLNRKTESLIEICEREGLNVFEALVRIAKDPINEPKLQFDALKELAQYLYPKRKAIEHSGPDGNAIQLEFNPYKDMSEEDLDKCLAQGKKR